MEQKFHVKWVQSEKLPQVIDRRKNKVCSEMSTLATTICYSELKRVRKKNSREGRVARRALCFLAFCFWGFRARAMKKKTSGEAIENPAGRVESATPVSPGKSVAAKKKLHREKWMEAAEVHQEIAGIVKASAAEIAQVLIDRALDGDAAAAKYLFEFARIFPTEGETNTHAKEEDSLAKTLMHRLNLPEEPIKIDDDEDGNVGASRDAASRVESVEEQKTEG